MREEFDHSFYESQGIHTGKDYFNYQIRSELSLRYIPEGAYSRVVDALNESYQKFVEYFSLPEPEWPEDITWSQMKLIRMDLDVLNKERDYRLAMYFCEELVDHVIAKEVTECKKLGLIQPRKKKQP